MHFSEYEYSILRAVAETALPAGRLIPAPGEDTYARIETFFTSSLPSVGQSYRAMLWALELRTLVGFGTRFSQLPPEQRLRALDAVARSETMRLTLRGLLTPLKLSHFDDPGIYQSLNCRFSVEVPKKPEAPRWQSQLSDAGAFSDGETLECDVVVVGSGAGGAPVAKALAERGHAVLILEEGQHYTRQDFNGRPLEMLHKAYRKNGATVAMGNTAIPIPVGVGVGGTTLINSGTCFRLPDATLAQWHDEFGLTEFSRESMAPYYEAVEAMLQVGPSSKKALGKPAEMIARGCDALGYSHQPLQRNAPDCDGQGLCCFGCPTDAKRSSNVSWVPAALDKGAQLLTGFKVLRVLVENERAVGVTGVAQGEGGLRRLTVRAQVVVLSCGSLYTPLLLLKDNLANTSGQVGRNLSIHPASSSIALFDEDLDSSNTVPQGYAIDHFHDEGLMFEGGQTPLDLTAASLTTYGPDFVALMEQFNHTMGFGFMVKDTSRGRVRLGSNGEPTLTYWLNAPDLAKVQRGHAILARVYFAAGATQVYPSVFGWERLSNLADVDAFEHAKLPARHVDLTAYHPLGTCRMGRDALTSVVDPTHETHDVHNLFLCDGSAVPSSLGVNPQLTIMAMALRAAEFIDRRLGRLRGR